MSLVAFPFKTENTDVVRRNLEIAAAHPRVGRILCVGFEVEETYRAIEEAAPAIAAAEATPIDLIIQERIGDKRPGKGDGMNTALKYFLDKTDFERLHFYDSDITSFGTNWITKAEEAADFGYGLVRHYFPRASTDGMITWLVTRTGFASLFPHSELPWVEQPLGGELLLKRHVVEALVADERVQAQSDWGIDTLYTFASIENGFPMFETYVREGKAHKLYGRLTDLRTMLVECFNAMQGLAGMSVPENVLHRVEPPDVVPEDIAEKIGFEFEATMGLLTDNWSARQAELLELFPTPIRDGMLANQQKASFGFMDEDYWYDTFLVLVKEFRMGDADWEELLFRLWLVRVLNYTVTTALRGFNSAQRYLRAMVNRYVRRTILES